MAWHKCQNSQNAQKCFGESAKGIFGPPERESQNSLLHGGETVFCGVLPGAKQGLDGATDSLGLSAQRDQIEITF